MIQLHSVYKTDTLDSHTNRLRVKQWEKIYYANSNQKRLGKESESPLLISDKLEFKTRFHEAQYKKINYISICY